MGNTEYRGTDKAQPQEGNQWNVEMWKNTGQMGPVSSINTFKGEKRINVYIKIDLGHCLSLGPPESEYFTWECEPRD